MKAFVAITLLAACAAAQTFDYSTGHRQQLLKREHGLTRMWKDIFGINKDYKYDFDTTSRNTHNYYPYTIPTSYNTETVNGVNILSLDEIIRHPLFQTYYTLPLFRQHFNHPLFRLFLTTPSFQQYWAQPIFTTFFRNPYLFNKYIYPIVYNTPTVAEQGIYDRDYETTNNIFGDYKTHTQIPSTYPWDTPTTTTYGKKYTDDIVYPFNTGYPINTKHIQYANIINKILNKPEYTQSTFDIQTPIHHKNTFEKFIDPITGEIKYNIDDFKTTDDKYIVNHNKAIDAVVERELKNELIKKIFLNKILYGDRKIHPNIPEIFKYNTYPRELINNHHETIIPREYTKYETIPRPFHIKKYETITPLTNYETIARKYETNIPREILEKFENIPRDLLAKYTITPIHKEQQEEIESTPTRKFVINRFGTIPRDQIITKPIIGSEEKLINNIKIETIPITKAETETLPIVKIEKEIENTPITTKTIEIEIRKDDETPKEHIHKNIDAITTTIPEITKKFDEMENKIDEVTKTETEETSRVKRHATTYYTPVVHTGQQVYTVPATQYVVGQQHHAQVPLTRTAQQVYTVPSTYTYGTQYTVPTTYGFTVNQPSSVYYPTHTYATA